MTDVRDASGTMADPIAGASPAMRELAGQVELLARNDRTTVLIVGEHGVGKGRIARRIHAGGARAAGPFVAVSCAATTGTPLDVALFGLEHAGGRDAAPGLLEDAADGSLFLEDVGDLDPTLQPRLLRTIEGRSFRRVGGTQEIVPRARMIAATHRDLVTEVTEGRFSEELYYRLNVMPVHLPPLRARGRSDLLALVASLLDELAAELPDAPRELDDEAAERLLAYRWPGNVRELRNVLERAMLLARAQERSRLEAGALPIELRTLERAGAEGERHVPRSLEEVEREHVARTLRAHDGNRTHAARELGISRATLIKKIRQFGL